MHPSKEITSSYGSELEGRRIVLAVTGSIAAYQTPDIAREIMRHGADVHAVTSDAAEKIIHPNALEWATGNPVVTELTGKIEHVAFTAGPTKADLILVAPCTANTLSKIAVGIDDTPVTSYVSSALGAKIPILIALAMHETMLDQPVILRHISELKRLGINFIEPRVEEGKAKVATPSSMVREIIRVLSKKDMRGLAVLVTAGPTVEYIDPIRILTNRSSGKMGVAMAEEASSRGADVTLIYGPGSAEPPSDVKVIRVQTTKEMYDVAVSELKTRIYDIFVGAAAATDYSPTRSSSTKISTLDNPQLSLVLQSSPKIVDAVKKTSPRTFLVAFRAEYAVAEDRLIEGAIKRMKSADADVIVANDVAKPGTGFQSEENEGFLIHRTGEVMRLERSPKRTMARRIFDSIISKIPRPNRPAEVGSRP